MNIIAQLEKEQVAIVVAQRAVPEFSPGDTVIVNVKVKEGEPLRKIKLNSHNLLTQKVLMQKQPCNLAWKNCLRNFYSITKVF